MYHVPPHKIGIYGHNSDNNSLETENANYVDSCLMHWIVRWESAISLQLLSEQERRSGLFFEFMVQSLLRGNSQARAEYYNKIFQVGGITPNQIRAKENMNPIDGGDESFVMLNMIPLSQAKEMNIEKEEPKEETEIEKKASITAYFDEKRVKLKMEKRSIMIRDRITKQYAPLIFDAATAIVNRETKSIKKQVARNLRSKEQIEDFLDDFYDTFPKYIDQKMGPVLRSFLTSIIDATNDEMKVDPVKYDKEINEFIDVYAKRHVSSSKGQMLALLEGALEDLDQRAGEWQEKRPEKITANETVRGSNYAFQVAVFGAGMSTVWRIRGPKTCPYCRSLEGKRIVSGQSFVNDGDELNPKGADGPMKIRGLKAHPPLHAKCLPGNANVSAAGITASSENWFDGNMVVIYTAAGNKITCTPNHPILTCHGWVTADKINIGFQVGQAIFSDRNPAIISDDKNMKSTIKDVSKSFVNNSKMIAIPMPTTSEDLKSDFSDSEITVIRTDGSLLFERNPNAFHELREFNLKLRDAGHIGFTDNSSFTEFIKNNLPSECSLVSGRNLLSSLSSGHVAPVDLPGFALSTMANAEEKKIFIDNCPGNIKPFGNRIDGFSIEILRDKVIGVEDNTFHGLVYNLHTKDKLFYAENIIVHNCDCYISAV